MDIHNLNTNCSVLALCKLQSAVDYAVSYVLTHFVMCRSTICQKGLSIASSLSAMMAAPYQQSILAHMQLDSEIS